MESHLRSFLRRHLRLRRGLSRPPRLLGAGAALALVLLTCGAARAESGGSAHGLLSGIGISIMAAGILAFLGHGLKQPLLLAYLAAGIAIGPQCGLGLVQKQDIGTIVEIGLILLLFMIGLELDLKKLKEFGRSLMVAGIGQFALCFLLGLGFFALLGFTVGPPYDYLILGVHLGGGEYDLLYLAAVTSLSSTAIVVKLLHEKFELDTLAGRLTLGVLVFQDLWAIILLSLQPTLADPRLLNLLQELTDGVILVGLSFLLSKYLLGAILRRVAKSPELMLVISLAWCFAICGLAHQLELSLEMGALVAGAAISTFPYNVDVIAKIVSIRDFFITLFFVALGMEIPNPLDNLSLFWLAGAVSVFVIASRFVSLYPPLYALKNGNRVSLLVPLNLSQVSEFALVIVALGISYKHIAPDIMTLVIYTFVITSAVSTYMIKYSHTLQGWLGRGAARLGLRDLPGAAAASEAAAAPKEIALLGFFRTASAFLEKLQALNPDLLEQLVVVDFNPKVHRELVRRGIKVVYGDLGHLDTLHHAGLAEAKLVISTIPDTVLVGTDNLKLVQHLEKVCPRARIVATAESPAAALKLYEAGADYVLLPQTLTADHLAQMLEYLRREGGSDLKEQERQRLRDHREVLQS